MNDWRPIASARRGAPAKASSRVLITPKRTGDRVRGVTIRIGYDVALKLAWNMTGMFAIVEDGNRIGIAEVAQDGWTFSSHGAQKKARTYVLCMGVDAALVERLCPGQRRVGTQWEFEIENSLVLVLTKPVGVSADKH